MRKAAQAVALASLAVALYAVPVASAKPSAQKVIWIHTNGTTSLPCDPLKPSCPIAHTASYLVAWENTGTHIQHWRGRYYADWQCDVGGTIVAGAAWWIWMSPPATALGMVAGVAFTVGCHLGADYNHAVKGGYYSDEPHEMYSDCMEVFPHGNKARRYKVCEA